MLRRFVPIVLLFSAFLPSQVKAQTTDADALKLLQQVAQKYAQATRSHIESVTETRNSGDLNSDTSKSFTFWYDAPGNRYRFGGRNSNGTGLVVSDGTTEWEFHAAFGEYIKRPVGTFGRLSSHPVDIYAQGPEEGNAYNRHILLGSLGKSLVTAHFLPEDTIQVGDRIIQCFVVGFGRQDYPKSSNDPGNSTYDEKVWIDKARLLVVRTEATSDYRAFGSVLKEPESHAVTTVDYPIVSLDEPIPDDVFKFVPPPDAKLVDNFTDRMAAYRKASAVPAPAAAVQSAQPTDDGALNLLHQVTQKYARAIRSHIESVEEVHNTRDLASFWRKEFTTEVEAPGSRYVFGGKQRSGAEGLVVSDGTTEYELHAAYGEYIKRPAGTFGHPFNNDPTAIQNEGPKERDAFFMRRDLGSFGCGLQSARFYPEETIQVGGRQIRCLVIGFGMQDYRNATQNPEILTWDNRVWIDKTRMVIVRTELAEDRRTFGTIGKGIVSHGVVIVNYPVVSLDEPIPDDAFKFVPPPNTKLVDNFTDWQAAYNKAAGLPPPTPAVQPGPPAVYPAPSAATPPSLVGTVAPDLTLFAADGRSLNLVSLRGKPVLIDLWATWCGPCLMEMPVIDRIYRFGKSAGLRVIGLDQDRNPADALDYLKKNGYAWDDYSDYHNGQYVSVALHPGGLPNLILIDAEGKIAYFHSGADDDAGLVAAIRRLGPTFAAAMDASEK